MLKEYQYKNFNIKYFAEIDSTNSYLLNQGRLNLAHEFEVAIADIQNQGRGRKNRKWQSYNENLQFSLLLKPKVKIIEISQLSILAVLALGEIIEELASSLNKEVEISYKWPNDLLLDSKKVAGILIENSIKNDQLHFVVIGMGVNLAKSPSSTIFPATNLKDLSLEINKIQFLERLLDKFKLFYNSWQDFGFANFRKLWLKKAYKVGQEIELTIDDKKIVGIFSDIDDLGSMILQQQEKIRSISFAEVL